MAVRAVLVTPLTGPLARFGTEGARALELWADRYQPELQVELAVHDAAPDVAAAVRAAVADRPDIVFGPYGSGPMRAAMSATQRLVWNHGGASLGTRSEVASHVINILAPADTYLVGSVAVARHVAPGSRRLALLHGDTGFGRMVADGAEAEAHRLGFEVERVSFPSGGAAEAVARTPGADVLCVAAGFGDELTLGRAVLDRNWVAAVFVGAGEEGVLDELGSTREGLMGPCQWLASSGPAPEIGPPADEFVAAFRSLVGRAPSYPAAQAFAAGLLAGHAVLASGTTDEETLRRFVDGLDITTLYGRFRLDPASRQQVGHRVVTVQWQEGDRRAVWPRDRAEVEPRRFRPASDSTA